MEGEVSLSKNRISQMLVRKLDLRYTSKIGDKSEEITTVKNSKNITVTNPSNASLLGKAQGNLAQADLRK
jgi:hypothetical protein